MRCSKKWREGMEGWKLKFCIWRVTCCLKSQNITTEAHATSNRSHATRIHAHNRPPLQAKLVQQRLHARIASAELAEDLARVCAAAQGQEGAAVVLADLLHRCTVEPVAVRLQRLFKAAEGVGSEHLGPLV